jgi:hypothetical protein
MQKKFNIFTGTFDYLGEGGEIVPGIESVTDAQLQAKIAANSLVPGVQYLFSDFRTKHNIEGTTEVHEDMIEPLIVTAVSGNKIGASVKSVTNATDIIEFDFTNRLCEDGITARYGKITFRKDKNGNEAPYDFRGVIFKRYTPDCPAWVSGANYIENQIAKVGNMIYKCVKKANGPVFDNLESPVNSDNWIKWLPTDKAVLAFPITMQYRPGFEIISELASLTYTASYFYSFSDASGLENSKMFKNIKIGGDLITGHYSNNIFVISDYNKTYNVSLDNGAINNSFFVEVKNSFFSGMSISNIGYGMGVSFFSAVNLFQENIINENANTTILGPCLGNIILNSSLSSLLSECVYNSIKKISNTITGSDFWANTVIDLRYSFISYHFKNNFVGLVSELNSKQKVEDCNIENGVRNCVIETELYYTRIPANTIQTTFAFPDSFGVDLSAHTAILSDVYYKKIVMGASYMAYIQYIDASGNLVNDPV